VLLLQLRRLAREPENGFSYVESSGESGILRSEEPPLSESEAKVVEGDGRMSAHPVGVSAGTAFTSFLDGIQRADVKLYHGPVPVVYAYTAAVVRARHERKLRTLDAPGAAPETAVRYYSEREGAFLPFRLVSPDSLAPAGISDAQLIDTSPPEGEPLPLFPPTLLLRAARKINAWREELEGQLAVRWCRESSPDEWLLVDGSLTSSPELSKCPRAVGIIKSHRTRFFDGDDARTVLGLQAGERTSVFRPGTRQVTPVYSWYLRLRPVTEHGIFWGLVRIEAAATKATLARVDEISRWLLAETLPLSLPDTRWDRLLYPIHDCEAFLRSRAPAL
jgi:hypothetical protein